MRVIVSNTCTRSSSEARLNMQINHIGREGGIFARSEFSEAELTELGRNLKGSKDIFCADRFCPYISSIAFIQSD